MATWPDLDEMLAWTGEIAAADEPVLQQCLDASVEYLTFRCTIEIDESEVPVVTENVRLACKLLASREFRRRQSPEGVAGFGDLGPIRVQGTDRDVEMLITPQVEFGIA